MITTFRLVINGEQTVRFLLAHMLSFNCNFPPLKTHNLSVKLELRNFIFHYRLGSTLPREKSRERRIWDICSISNVACKNCRKNLTIYFGALANAPSSSVSSFLLYCTHFFTPAELFFYPMKDVLELSLSFHAAWSFYRLVVSAVAEPKSFTILLSPRQVVKYVTQV